MTKQLVTDGLVAHWDMTTWTSGTTWVDSVNNKIITFSSAPSSKSDDGIELTTSTTFTSASLSSLSLSNACTFEWLGRIDGTWSNSSPGNVFGLNTSSGSWSGGILCYTKISNGVQLDLSSSGSITSSAAGTSAGLYHIIVTVSGTTTTLYVNSTSARGTSTKSAGYANKYYLYNNEGSGRFYGAIERMCLWNKCLSSTEIATLFEDETTTYDVSITSSGNGTTTPTGTQTVSEGGSLTIKMVPDDGYKVSSITVNGESVVPAQKQSSTEVTFETSTSHGTYSGSYSNMFDKDSSTYWWSNDAQSVGSYLMFTFTDSIILNSITIVNNYNTDYISTGTVLQVSTDGSSWTDCGYFSGTSSSTVSCSVTEGIKYVRCYVNTASNKWLTISEITIDYSTEEADPYYEYEVSNITEEKTVVVIYSKIGTEIWVKSSSGTWTQISVFEKTATDTWEEINKNRVLDLINSGIYIIQK